ncbi:MAG: Crp/Fnr family transcriptional regulator, partial [Mucilaginibacter sp.]|nr:Crp/Fnr family transcriptional regulator [Mucilaginibacter sp.]
MELLLNTIRHFIPLSAADEEIVRRLFHKKTFKKGEHLLQAGNICRYVIFIETGLVRYYYNTDGEERTNYFNKEGEFVCDYKSFMPQVPTYVNIQALEDTVIWVISFNDIQQLYKEVQYGERFGRLAIEQVFVVAIDQVASLYVDPPDVRYSKFLSNFKDIAQRIPQYYIASY